MSELHYVTLGRGEPLIDAMVRWDATLPSGALNVFCYRHEDITPNVQMLHLDYAA